MNDSQVRHLRGPWVRSWPLLLAIACCAISVTVAVHFALEGTDGHLIYALDDAYIHMAMAKNMARHGVWGCTPHHFSSSSSSILWTLALSAAYGVTGVREQTPLVLNVALALATLIVADGQLRRFGVAASTRAATLVGMVVAFQMAGMVLLGMEHILHLLLTIAFAGAAVSALTVPATEAAADRRGTLLVCGLAALLGASRYEGLFLVGLVSLASIVRRRLRLAVWVAGAGGLPIVVLGVVSMASGGWFFPNSLMLKAGGEAVSTTSILTKPIGPDVLALFQQNRGLLVLFLGGVAATAARGLAGRDIWKPHVLFPLLLTLMIVLHAHLAFSSTFWVYRYDLYLVGFGVWSAAIVLGGREMDAQASPGVVRALVAPLAVVLLVAVVSDVRRGIYPADAVAGARSTYVEHYEAARFVRRYFGREAVVINDLGAMSYLTNTRVLDIFGLGDIEPLRIRRAGAYTKRDVQQWTAPHAPAIAVLQLGWGWVVPRIPEAWVRVAELDIPATGQRLGFFAIDPSVVERLRQTVGLHYEPLAKPVGYTLRVF